MCIVEVLGNDREQLPEWLAGDNPPRFDRAQFFASRTVYYPGCGDDGQPVKLCALAHAAHTFVYVDYGIKQEGIAATVHDPERGLRGYEVTREESISEDALEALLRPEGWTPLYPDEYRGADRWRLVDPFGRFVIFDRRQSYNDRHGPQRLAILFIGDDGIASYDALYCRGDGTPSPFLVVVQNHGLGGGNYDSFGRGGLLESIVWNRQIRPEYLLVGRNTPPWWGYADTGAPAEPGGSQSYPRRLFRRRRPAA